MLSEGRVVAAIQHVDSEAEGYLRLCKGEELEVLYVGGDTPKDRGWIYAQKTF